VSHSDRPVEAARSEGRVLVRDDATNGAAHYDHVRVRELLSDYLDGSMSPAEREQTDEHLDHCDACRAFRNTLGKVIDTTSHFPTPRLRDAARQRILSQLEEASTPS
jgi:anti-sigma factor RsiW